MTAAEFFTVAVAVYAAVVATEVAIWDVVKWKMQGPSLEVEAQSAMKLYGGGAPDEREFIVMRVTNRGDRPTTITNMGYLLYRDDFMARWSRNSNTFAAIVPNPSEAQPIFGAARERLRLRHLEANHEAIRSPRLQLWKAD